MKKWTVTKVDANGKYLPPVEIEGNDPPTDEYTVSCVEVIDKQGKEEQVVHELKTDSEVYQAVAKGNKTFEIRKNDRGFATGDYLWLRETAYTGEEMANGQPLLYTGNEVVAKVAYILDGPIYGLKDGWCIMSVSR